MPYSDAQGLDDVETDDRLVGERRNNFFRTLQLTYNTYRHSLDTQSFPPGRSNS